MSDNYVVILKINNDMPGKARAMAKQEIVKALREFGKALPEGVYLRDYVVSQEIN